MVVWTVVFVSAYTLAVWNNYALFTYHAALYELVLGVDKAKDGPAMYWYGWIATSAIAAGLAGLAACWLPESLTRRIWSGWAWLVPLASILFFAWLLRGYFLR